MKKDKKLPAAIREVCQKVIKKNGEEDNGWGGRIRTLEWRDQNPLPYRLATPQSQEECAKEAQSRLLKNTITRLKAVLVLSIFLCSNVLAVNTSSFNSKLALVQNLGRAIKNARFFKNGILYSSQNELYFNQEKINLLSAEDAQIQNIEVAKNKFFISSNLGLFENYRRIFSGENCFHAKVSTKQIFLSCQNNIYRADYDSKKLQANFNWQALALSPRAVNFFTLNKSKSNIEYAVGIDGFYRFDTQKKQWQKNNIGLKRDFQDSYGFGRFLVKKNKKEETIYLATSSGVYLSSNKGKSWISFNKGIKANPDGFYSIREIKEIDQKIYAATSTGLYYLDDGWQPITINSAQENENNNQDIYSLDSIKSKQGTQIIVSNSQGQIFFLNENQTKQVSVQKNYSKIISTDIKKTINQILKSEPKVKDLHKEALSFAGIPSGKKFRSYKRQARLRNLLPSFKTNLGKNQQGIITIERSNEDNFNSNTSSLSTGADYQNTNRNDNTNNRAFNFDWKLGNLIYDPEINDINTSARITANIRENILTEVTQIYFQRKEVLLELLNNSLNQSFNQNSAQFFKQKIDLEQYTAQLDARTGSWFSKALEDKLSDTLSQLEKSLSPIIIENIKELYNAV